MNLTDEGITGFEMPIQLLKAEIFEIDNGTPGGA